MPPIHFISLETMAKRFTRANPADIAEILETLCTMGHAHRGKTKGTYLPWCENRNVREITSRE